MNKLAKKESNSQGFVMAVLMITVTLVMILIVSVASLAITNFNIATRETYKVNAQLTADAGIDVAINELNINNTWTDSGGEVTLLNTAKLRTTYETVLLPGASDDRKILSVTARAYSPRTDTTPKVTRSYELDIQAVTSGTGITSVVSGVGGLVLNGNSKITGGDVIVNGNVTMENGSQIGTQTNSVNLRVAHKICPIPADATYPQVCTTGQPIVMGNTAKIYADVRATNQTNGTNMFNPGLIVGSSATPVSLPEYDRSLHNGATEYSPLNAAVRCPRNGNVTWPANIKINGNYQIGSKCKLTITGKAWITGSFTSENNSEIFISDALGTTRPVVMVDGAGGFVISNNGYIYPNASGSGIEIRTFWANSACTPTCTNLTGTSLANSQNVKTIDLSNNGNAPNSVFIAQWSRVTVANNGALGAIAGQSIELGNNAVINFTASLPGSDNLTQTYVKRGYIRVYE